MCTQPRHETLASALVARLQDLADEAAEHDVGREAEVRQLLAGERRGAALPQPLLDGAALVGLPVARDHRVLHRLEGERAQESVGQCWALGTLAARPKALQAARSSGFGRAANCELIAALSGGCACIASLRRPKQLRSVYAVRCALRPPRRARISTSSASSSSGSSGSGWRRYRSSGERSTGGSTRSPTK